MIELQYVLPTLTSAEPARLMYTGKSICLNKQDQNAQFNFPDLQMLQGLL